MTKERIMLRFLGLLFIAAICSFGLISLTAAQEGEETPEQYNFVGVDGCKMCHKTAKSGDQYGKWLEGPHSKAYATLATEEAKKVAVGAGVEGDPQQADACLRCHVTAHGVAAERLEKKYTVEEGVGCESCHGAGSGYKPKKIMEDHQASLDHGMIEQSKEVCLTCHNPESPTYKEFVYEEAVKQIAHPTPPAEGE